MNLMRQILIAYLIIIAFRITLTTTHAQTPTPACSLPSISNSSLATYARTKNFNISVQINECINVAHNDTQLCQSTVSNNFAGMMMNHQASWRGFEPSPGQFNTTLINPAISFIDNLHSSIHFSHGLWSHHEDTYTPEWVFPNRTSSNCGTQTKAGLNQIMKNRFLSLNQYYAGRISAINVVNEAFNDTGIIQDCFYHIGGNDYIDRAFQYARQAMPNTLLVLNEYFRENPDGAKAHAMFNYIKSAKARGIPIDAVGIQNHLRSIPGSSYYTQLDNFMKNARDANVKVLITEMDVYQGNDTQTEVANTYHDVMALCLKYNRCISLNTWGVSDKYSWFRNSINNLTDAQPLLFDEYYQRKLAYNAVAQAIVENTSRPCVIATPTPTPTPTLTIHPTISPTVSASPTIDLNSDSHLDIEDVFVLLSNMFKIGNPGWIPADINKDGMINIFDYQLLIKSL